MRLKTYFAPTLQEAMDHVRRELGGEAIIISSTQEKTGVRVTAALEQQIMEKPSTSEVISKDALLSHVTRCLTFHGVPTPLSERILRHAETSTAVSLEEAPQVWSAFFQDENTLSDRFAGEGGVILLTGTPGAGKSVCVAKLAVEALLADRRVHIVTLDEGKAGALEQLSAYASHLKVDVCSFTHPKEMIPLLKERQIDDFILIDTPGINPFSKKDLAFIAECVFITQCVPHWVFPAGCDVWEALDMAESFKDLGVREIIHTKGDVAKRQGALLSVLAQEPFQLMAFSQGPTLAHRLVDAKADTLHDLLKSEFFVQLPSAQVTAVASRKQVEKKKETREPVWLARLREAKG
ncbi:MAG: hypothetical protein ACK5TR_01745 [Alphaproteobacteria bacterium]|jgi:flagellar biosynthesis protein FlhF|nr:hypothetical protein [Alphaproteobacteria bacterium]